jgi:hypothetical protein
MSKKIPFGDLFVLLFFLIGAFFAGISYYIYQGNQDLVKNGVATKGLVIGMHRIDRKKYPVAPSVRYFTLDGKEHVFHSSEGRNPPEYQIGEEVKLYYNPKNPEEVYLDGNYLLVYVFAGMASVFWLISIWGVPSSLYAIWFWIRN